MTRPMSLLLLLTSLVLGTAAAAQDANEVDMAVDPITPIESGAEIEPSPQDGAGPLDAGSRAAEAEVEAAFQDLVADRGDRAGWPNSTAEFMATREDLSIFLMLLEEAELTESLAQEEGPVTILAPTDAAFARMDQREFEALFDDAEGLRGFLQRHIAAGTYTSADLSRSETTEGVAAEIAGGGAADDIETTLYVDEAQFVERDLTIDGLTLHVIDRVLLPVESGVSDG